MGEGGGAVRGERLAVGIVADSACSLPAALVESHGVHIVPMWVNVGGKAYRDGDLPMSEVVARLGEGLSTSGPAPGDFVAACQAADGGDGVVVLTVSRRMSSCYEAAQLAAKLSGEDEEREVVVVDTGTAAGAEGLVVLAASRAAQAGCGLAGVAAAAGRAAGATRLVATLPSLEHLARGGRVPGAAAWGARWLGLNPVFEFKEARVRALRPARGAPLAYRRILEAFWRDLAGARRAHGQVAVHAAALHAMDEAVAEGLLADVTARTQLATQFVGSFSPVMVAHTGPGLVGLAWWLEDVRRAL